MALFSSVSSAPKTESIENSYNAPVTDNDLSAESSLPVNGKLSGPLWHWLLRLILQTLFAKRSVSLPRTSGSLPKRPTCCLKNEPAERFLQHQETYQNGNAHLPAKVDI